MKFLLTYWRFDRAGILALAFLFFSTTVTGQTTFTSDTVSVEASKVITNVALYQSKAGTVLNLLTKNNSPSLDNTEGTAPVSTGIDNPLHLRCFFNKDLCLVSGNFKVKALNLVTSAFQADSGFYEFLSSPSPDAQPLEMKLEAVHETDYFLLFVTAKYGVLRYKLGNYKKFAKLDTI